MKRGNLFDSINENFFRILTGQNKRFYADCLIEMQEVSIFTDAADFDRERVNQIISNCMDWYADTLAEENTEDEVDTNELPGQEKVDTRCPPTKDSVFRKLLACGWIDADFDDQTHRQLVSFTVPALTILPELKRMAQPSRISLGGYTRNIIENLKAVMTVSHPYQDAFMLALNNTYQFMQEMAKIRISIRNEVEMILRCKNLEEMTSMLSAYLDSYLGGDYYKLQFAENLTAVERKQITGLLMDIENDEVVFQKLIEGAMDYMSIDNEDDANLRLHLPICFQPSAYIWTLLFSSKVILHAIGANAIASLRLYLSNCWNLLWAMKRMRKMWLRRQMPVWMQLRERPPNGLYA